MNLPVTRSSELTGGSPTFGLTLAKKTAPSIPVATAKTARAAFFHLNPRKKGGSASLLFTLPPHSTAGPVLSGRIIVPSFDFVQRRIYGYLGRAGRHRK